MALVKCPECGKMISDKSENCVGCGFPINGNSSSSKSSEVGKVKKEKTKRKPINKRLVKTLAIVIPVIAIIVAAIVFLNSSAFKYILAQNAEKKNNYEKAIELYSKLGDYKDSPIKLEENQKIKTYKDASKLKEERKYDEAISLFESLSEYNDSTSQITDCYYLKAVELEEAGNIDEAVETYSLVLDYEDTKDRVFKIGESYITSGDYSKASSILSEVSEDYPGYKEYATAMVAFENKKYDEALTNFRKSNDLYDSADMANESLYNKGKADYDSGNYKNAQNSFRQASGYKDSDQLYKNCDFLIAKQDFDEGNLHSARTQFKSLDEDFTVNGKSVKEYLEKLENNSTWVDMCGKWECDSGTAITKETHRSTGAWDAWEYDMSYSNMAQLNVRCVLQDDGSVKVKIQGSFFKLTNYSILSSQVNQTDHSVYVEKIVNGLGAIECDSNTTITLNTDKIRINYKKVDDNSNMYFTETYTTDCNLKKKMDY